MLSYEKEARDLGKIRLVGGESLVSLPVRFSKDSRYFFCCGGSNVYVFSSDTGSLVRELKEHSGEVTGFCANSKNEFQLISCCMDGEVIIWDYTDGAVLKKLNLHIQLFGVFTHSHHEDYIFLVRKSFKGKHIKQKMTMLDLKDVDSSKETDLENLFSFSGSPWNCAFSKKGKCIAYVKQKELGIWNTKTKESKSYTYEDSIFTCVAFHPNEFCIAAGDTEGKIILWQGILSNSPVTMEFHWHAHAVTSLAFSHDGSHVMSGGQESVLVVWQYSSNTKQFLPRMGAPISHISCSRDDKLIAVCLQDNLIKLISGVDLNLRNIVQGLRKASFMCKKLVFDPRSGSLVMNSSPGVLQFYDPKTDKGIFVVDIVKQNIISTTETEKLYFTQVHFVSFTEDGKWMSTIEYRNDHYTSDETRLKFWEFNSTTQCYTINTVIDLPHDRPTIALAFQPLNKLPNYQPLAVTAGRDGKFKIWVLRQSQTVSGTKTFSWACQSVGYYNDTPCLDAVFSEDGELLAVAYSNIITLWTPNSNILQKSMHLPFPDDAVRFVTFGCHESSHYLMVSTSEFLIVWDLLTCSILWTIEANVAYLIADPNSKYIAAFIVFERKTHLYLFDPSTPSPVGIQTYISRKAPIFSAAFDPKVTTSIPRDNTSLKISKLYFLTKAQELFTLSTEDDQPVKLPEMKNPANETSQDFLRVFGQSTKTAGESTLQRTGKTLYGEPSSTVIREMLTIPSHVLPSVSALCTTFLTSLLVSKDTASPKEDIVDGIEDDGMRDGSDSDSDIGEPPSKESAKLDDKIQDDNAQVDEISLNTVSYSWLTLDK